LRYLASVAAVPPGSGEAITIEARKVVTFKPGSVLKNAINGEAA
jgi:nucleoid DNA-binding protein